MKRSLFFVTIVINLFLYSFQIFARTIVISDIDDTIKKSNSMGKGPEQIYHFLRKIPYLEMRDLYKEIENTHIENNDSIKFFYVSAAYKMTFNAQNWLTRYNFPKGDSILKTFKTKDNTYNFKHDVIKNIIEKEKLSLNKNDGEVLEVLMFGDNAQVDAVVYNDLSHELNINSKIYIRDVRAEATFFDSTLPLKKIDGINYYFSEIELLNLADFDFISSDLKNKIIDSYKKRTLIPNYTFKTINRRLDDLYKDKEKAQIDTHRFWNDYYIRY